jgi:hypothetical protein
MAEEGDLVELPPLLEECGGRLGISAASCLVVQPRRIKVPGKSLSPKRMRPVQKGLGEELLRAQEQRRLLGQ